MTSFTPDTTDSGLAAYIHEANVAELDGDFFDIAWYKKEQQSDGTLMVSAECEHVSYRLNDSAHNVEYFTLTATPAVILSAIVAGTGFTVGTVDYSNPVTFSLQEPSSRRSLLMQFAAYLKGELAFHGFTISLLSQRGSTAPKAVSVGRDVTVISKVVSKREQDENGNPMVSYTCGVFKGAKFDLGDKVLLNYSALDIAAELRVLGKSYDPYNPNNVAIEIGNYTNSLEDDLYRIETESVSKDTLMNGCRIGPKYGFEAVRNDKKARAFFKSDGMKLQTGDGTGNTWTDKLYYAVDTDTGNILTNEKYKGDALLQKKFTVDFLQKKLKPNEGEVPQYYVEGSHPAIIEPDEWDQVQAEFARRKQLGRTYSGKSVLSTKLVCADCGGYYGQKVWHSTDQYRRVIWQCNSKFENDKKCGTPALNADTIQAMFIKVYNRLMQNQKQVIEDCELMRRSFTEYDALDAEIARQLEETEVVAELVKAAVKENASTAQSQEEYLRKYNSLSKRYEDAVGVLENLKAERTLRQQQDKSMSLFIRTLKKNPQVLNKWDDTIWTVMVERGIVYRNGSVKFVFYNGTEIEVGVK